MKLDEFKPVLEKGEWIPYELAGNMPDWMKNIPRSKIHSIYASGSGVEPQQESGHKNVIGGFDIYRYAEKEDGVNFNKDHAVVIKDPASDDMLLVIETPKADDSEHWVNDIPEELEKAEIISMKKQPDNYTIYQRLKSFLWIKKLYFIFAVIFLIFLYLYFVLQGVPWIIFNYLFFMPAFIILVVIIISFLCNLPNFIRYYRKKIDKYKYFYNRNKLKSSLIFFIIIIGSLSGGVYLVASLNIKASLNDQYLNDIVSEIVENKDLDIEKISAILNWFDRDLDHMHNSWLLNNNGKLLYVIPFFDIIVFNESFDGFPGLCIRCTKNIDARWILTSRCGACDEYSRLFMIMVDKLGYDVRRVHAPGEDHLWNEVKIDGDWIPVDPTNVSSSKGGDGWEHYGFFEHKEGNASYVWVDYLHNDTIEDLTNLYTNLTKITLHCISENNESISNMKITIISHNLRRDPNWETYIKGQTKPKTNETGYCTFQIGGGNYTFKAENDYYSGNIKWIEFSDQEPSHDFIINVNKK